MLFSVVKSRVKIICCHPNIFKYDSFSSRTHLLVINISGPFLVLSFMLNLPVNLEPKQFQTAYSLFCKIYLELEGTSIINSSSMVLKFYSYSNIPMVQMYGFFQLFSSSKPPLPSKNMFIGVFEHIITYIVKGKQQFIDMYLCSTRRKNAKANYRI